MIRPSSWSSRSALRAVTLASAAARVGCAWGAVPPGVAAPGLSPLAGGRLSACRRHQSLDGSMDSASHARLVRLLNSGASLCVILCTERLRLYAYAARQCRRSSPRSMPVSCPRGDHLAEPRNTRASSLPSSPTTTTRRSSSSGATTTTGSHPAASWNSASRSKTAYAAKSAKKPASPSSPGAT